MSRVRKIKPVCIASKPLQKPSKNKVAAYARVSTYNDEQLNSLEAQKDYYEKKIRENPSWMFAGIYVDEGITGTSYAHRAEFLRMIEDCKNGKIDMVLTKSVSRFARNTVDALNVIRELKEIGVGVYFERENVWTLDSKGEFLITLLTSLAQEEARSISENTAWGIRKRFADGQYAVGYKHFLGYNAGFEVNKEQAVFVRLIFRMYIQGYSTCRIAKILQEWEIKSPANGDRWHPSSVISILKNEKYKGDALLQKSFTVDFLTKKAKKNEGELQQYYVHEGHEAIIDAMAFDYTQTLITTRYLSGREKYSGITPASSFLRCGVCGAWYGPKPEHSNDKYRNGCSSVNTRVHFTSFNDRLSVCIHYARSGRRVSIDEVCIRIGLIVRLFDITVSQRILDSRQRWYRLAVALELGLSFLVCCLNGCFNLVYGNLVILWNDEGNRILRLAAMARKKE